MPSLAFIIHSYHIYIYFFCISLHNCPECYLVFNVFLFFPSSAKTLIDLFELPCIALETPKSGQFEHLWLAGRCRNCPFRSTLWLLLHFLFPVQESLATQSMEIWMGPTLIVEWYSYESKRLAIKDEFFVILFALGVFQSSIAITL